jgi:hypothetical protein
MKTQSLTIKTQHLDYFACAFTYLATLLYANDLDIPLFQLLHILNEDQNILNVIEISNNHILSLVINILFSLQFNILHPCIDPMEWNIPFSIWVTLCHLTCFPTLSHSQLMTLAQDMYLLDRRKTFLLSSK